MQMNKMALIIFLTRRPLVGGFFLLLLVMAGCAENDRYEFVVGPLPGAGDHPILDAPPLVPISTPDFYALNPRAALLDDAGTYLAAVGVRIVQVVGDHYRTHASPGGRSVAAMARDAGGEIVSIATDGVMGRWDGQEWAVTGEDAGTGPYRGLLQDGQGRLVAYGRFGSLSRRETDGWHDLDCPFGGDLQVAWSNPGQPLVLVGADDTTLVALILTDDVWQEDRLPLSNHFWGVSVTGSDTGTILLAGRDQRDSWLHESGSWRAIPAPVNATTAVFFAEGRFHGAGGPLVRWTGEPWEHAANTSEFVLGTVSTVDGTLLIGRDGILSRYRKDQLEELLPAFGSPRGIAEDRSGSLVMQSSRGLILERDDPGWRILVNRTLLYEAASEGIYRDDEGRIVVAEADGLQVLDGTSLQPVPGTEGLWQVYDEPDGRLILERETGYDLWSGGRLTFICGRIDDSFPGRIEPAMLDDRFYFISWYGLYTVENEVPVALMTFPDNIVRNLRSDPDHGLLIAGNTVVTWREDESRDLGPYLDYPLNFNMVCGDGTGGLLAYERETERFLLYRDGEWASLGRPGSTPYIYGVIRLLDGSFLFRGSGLYWHMPSGALP